MNRQIEVTCVSADETKKVGQKIGELVNAGQVIELVGDVGSGKTTFTKGVAKGLEITEEITSPTFNIKNEYVGRLRLNHLDLYRLDQPGLVENEINELQDEKDSVTVIEWAGSVQDVLSSDRIIIEFKTTGENTRKLKISLPDNLELKK
ncbi:tRNA (adenosine(37)-N6)-threonylcarbamoyltransferase complex ATPase subunit type 1 TsaE [Candidatus Saccharibacteria bacterium]|nr:tRNA (adenosine(37)-N6)-threonylcarbamoyltransferase complex ATPase subunit type 1 TsaE [Candidatus Saccharibacteria bacterium]